MTGLAERLRPLYESYGYDGVRGQLDEWDDDERGVRSSDRSVIGQGVGDRVVRALGWRPIGEVERVERLPDVHSPAVDQIGSCMRWGGTVWGVSGADLERVRAAERLDRERFEGRLRALLFLLLALAPAAVVVAA